MAENSKIEWADHIDRNATGRTLGAYKTAAQRTGCSLEEWMDQRTRGNRWCFRCRSWKARDLFSLDKSRRAGRSCSCKECTSDASTASRYGMSPQQLKDFRDAHSHRCGICSATKILYVDHNHETGVLRGLLCPSCNSAIGLLGESKERFAAAVAYLEKHNG